MFEFLGDIFDPMFFYVLGFIIFFIWIIALIISIVHLIRGEYMIRGFDNFEILMSLVYGGVILCGLALYISSTEYLNSLPK